MALEMSGRRVRNEPDPSGDSMPAAGYGVICEDTVVLLMYSTP
jgi:hypothetical protein